MSTDIWTRIRSVVYPGAKILNWTYLGRGRKETMTVVDVSQTAVRIKSPNAEMTQNVPRKDFEKVWEIWSGYKSGRIKRGDLTPITRYSKYIISIFKWMER